jgi:hypothetical protein
MDTGQGLAEDSLTADGLTRPAHRERTRCTPSDVARKILNELDARDGLTDRGLQVGRVHALIEQDAPNGRANGRRIARSMRMACTQYVANSSVPVAAENITDQMRVNGHGRVVREVLGGLRIAKRLIAGFEHRLFAVQALLHRGDLTRLQPDPDAAKGRQVLAAPSAT